MLVILTATIVPVVLKHVLSLLKLLCYYDGDDDDH